MEIQASHISVISGFPTETKCGHRRIPEAPEPTSLVYVATNQKPCIIVEDYEQHPRLFSSPHVNHGMGIPTLTSTHIHRFEKKKIDWSIFLPFPY